MSAYQTNPANASKRGRGRPRRQGPPTISDRVRAKIEPLFAIQPRLRDTEIAARLDVSPQWVWSIRQLLKVPRATRPPKREPQSILWCFYRHIAEAGLKYCPTCRGVYCFLEFGHAKQCKECNSTRQRHWRQTLKETNPQLLKELDRLRNSRNYRKVL